MQALLFLKKHLIWCPWLWDPLYQTLQVVNVLESSPLKWESWLAMLQCCGLPIEQPLSSGPQSSGGLLFLFCLFPFCACVSWWLTKLFLVSEVSGQAVWPVWRALDKNGDIQLLVPCSWWVFLYQLNNGLLEPSLKWLLQRTVGCPHRLLLKVPNSWHSFCLCTTSFAGCPRNSWASWKDLLSQRGARSSQHRGHPFPSGLSNPSRAQWSFEKDLDSLLELSWVCAKNKHKYSCLFSYGLEFP